MSESGRDQQARNHVADTPDLARRPDFKVCFYQSLSLQNCDQT
jgi:hypothetical protein